MAKVQNVCRGVAGEGGGVKKMARGHFICSFRPPIIRTSYFSIGWLGTSEAFQTNEWYHRIGILENYSGCSVVRLGWWKCGNNLKNPLQNPSIVFLPQNCCLRSLPSGLGEDSWKQNCRNNYLQVSSIGLNFHLFFHLWLPGFCPSMNSFSYVTSWSQTHWILFKTCSNSWYCTVYITSFLKPLSLWLLLPIYHLPLWCIFTFFWGSQSSLYLALFFLQSSQI